MFSVRNVLFTLCLPVLLAGAAHAQSSPRRVAGIDIGAKGIKGVIAEVPSETTQAVRIVENKTINPTLFTGERLSESGLAEADEGVGQLLDWAAAHGVSRGDAYVVASSSVASAPNRDQLAQSLKERHAIDLKFMTRDEEARLSFLGLVSQNEQPQGVLIDIGSGNTKGGALREGRCGGGRETSGGQ